MLTPPDGDGDGAFFAGVESLEVDPRVRAAYAELANAAEILAGSISSNTIPVEGADGGELKENIRKELNSPFMSAAKLRQEATFAFVSMTLMAEEFAKKIGEVLMMAFLTDTLEAVCPGRYRVASAHRQVPLSYVYSTADEKCRIKGYTGDIGIYDQVVKRWVMFIAMDAVGTRPGTDWHSSSQSPACVEAAGQAICAAMMNEDRGGWALVVLTNFSNMRVFACDLPRIRNGCPPGTSTAVPAGVTTRATGDNAGDGAVVPISDTTLAESDNFSSDHGSIHEGRGEALADDVVFGTPIVYRSGIISDPAAKVAALVSSLSKAMLQVLAGTGGRTVPATFSEATGICSSDDDSSSGASSDGDDGVSGNGRPAQWLCQPQWRRTESCGETYRATQGSTAKKSDQQNKGTWPVA